MTTSLTLGVVDYVVLAVVLLIPMAIGIVLRLRSGKMTTSDYLIGDRRMSYIPVAISLAVSYVSGITILGTSTEVYLYGITMAFGYVGAVISLVLALTLMVPLYHPLQLTSINQYIMLRFNSRALLLFGWIVNAIMLLIMNGLFLFAPAVMLQQALGLSVNTCMILMGVGATIYTSVGGYRSVIWTDVFQTSIILLGICFVIIRGSIKSGGIGKALQAYNDAGRFAIDTRTSIHERQTVWGLIVSNISGWIILYGCSSTAVQRICSVPTRGKAQMMMAVAGPLHILFGFLTIFCGVISFGYYAIQKCDPFRGGYITNPNQLLPYFAMEVMSYPGTAGLFYSALICGSLSNLSSALSGLTALTWMDLVAQRCEKRSEGTKVIITTVITVILGLLSLLVGVALSSVGGTLQQISFSILACPAPAVIILYFISSLIPRINWKSTLTGCICGMLLVMWITVGNLFNKVHQEIPPTDTSNCTMNIVSAVGIMNTSAVTTPDSTTYILPQQTATDGSSAWFPKVSFHYTACFGCLFGVAIAVATSFLPGFSEENNDIRALSPLVRRFARRAQGRVDYINVDVDEADTNGKILTELKTRGMKA